MQFKDVPVTPLPKVIAYPANSARPASSAQGRSFLAERSWLKVFPVLSVQRGIFSADCIPTASATSPPIFLRIRCSPWPRLLSARLGATLRGRVCLKQAGGRPFFAPLRSHSDAFGTRQTVQLPARSMRDLGPTGSVTRRLSSKQSGCLRDLCRED